MFTQIRAIGLAATLTISALAVPAVATAHNAGHFFLPDGSCHEVGCSGTHRSSAPTGRSST